MLIRFAGVFPSRRNQKVRQRSPTRDRYALAFEGRMPAARNSDEAFFDGGFTRDASRRLHKRNERAVDLLSVKGGDNPRAIGRPIYSWCRCTQPFSQRNQSIVGLR